MRLKVGRSLLPFLALLIVGLVVTFYGYTRLNSSLNPVSVKSETDLGGMLLGWSSPTAVLSNHTVADSIRYVYVQLTVNPSTKDVNLQVDFQTRISRTHQFSIILPFQTRNPLVLQNESVGGTVTDAQSVNLTGSSSMVSFAWTDLHNYSAWESGSGVVVAKAIGNLISSQKGEDEFYLPIGVYPSSDVVQVAERSSPQGVTFPGPTSIFAINFSQVSVVLPPDAKLEQVIPSFADIERTNASLTVNLQNLFAASSVTVDYQDVRLAGAYADEFFQGEIFVVLGSVVTVGAFGTALFLRRRSKEGSDLAELSESPRRLASVMFMDIVGYSRLTHEDEKLAMQALQEQRDVVRPLVRRYTGREIKTIGDGLLVEFASALDAVSCAFDIQNAFHGANFSRPAEKWVLMRIGIHLGDVIHTRSDVFGDAVNMASRVEPLAPPGGVAFTRQVYEEVRNKVNFTMENLGPQKLKNIGEGYELFRIIFPWEMKSDEEAKPDQPQKDIKP